MTLHFRKITLLAAVWVILLAACNNGAELPTSLAPSIHLEEATNITRTSASICGEVIPNGTGTISLIQIKYGLTEEMDRTIVCNPEELEVSANLSGLEPGKTYYYCLEAGNRYTIVSSGTKYFATAPNVVPTISTPTMLNQGPLSITLTYEILDNGGENITSTGFYYRKKDESEEHQISLPTNGSNRMSARIANLQVETEYSIQAYASNSIGETRSDIYSFRTGQAVILTQAGTLPEAVDENEKYQFPNLSIAGPLNGTDIRYLRDMMGKDINGNDTPGRLKMLNLNDASIVAGGLSYDGQRYTADNIIGRGMFSNCTWLQELTLPATAKTIEENAFESCRSLSALYFSPQLEQFEPSAGCISLSVLEVPPANPSFSSMDGILYNKEQTLLIWYPEGRQEEQFQIPTTVTDIGKYAFRNSLLRRIDLPASIKNIGQGAFTASSLEGMVLPDNISLIPNGCFQHCDRLVSLTMGSSTAYLSEYCFDGCNSLQYLYVKAADFPPVCQTETFAGAEQLFEGCTLHVPSGCKSIYRNHRFWGQFLHIVEQDAGASQRPSFFPESMPEMGSGQQD